MRRPASPTAGAGFLLSLLLGCVSRSGAAPPSGADGARGRPVTVSPELRRELLAARDAAWRAFYRKDPAALERLLGPELIAIQEGEEKWEPRDDMIEVARQLTRADGRLLRLEFPKTEIQVFGDTAILYYTYVFETEVGGKSAGLDAGRGTEIFVRRSGAWVDVGWHLDNGAFVYRDGTWTRLGAYPPPPARPEPEPSARAAG